ncbi:MAG: hypothetical protein RLZZ450_1759, partial [Pseudomonadota bacterium]
ARKAFAAFVANRSIEAMEEGS